MADEKSTNITTNDPTVARIFAATDIVKWALTAGSYRDPVHVAQTAAELFPVVFGAIRDASRG